MATASGMGAGREPGDPGGLCRAREPEASLQDGADTANTRGFGTQRPPRRSDRARIEPYGDQTMTEDLATRSLDIDQDIRELNWWPTQLLEIHHSPCEELNRELARLILEQEEKVVRRGMPTPVAGLQEGLTTHWLEYNVLKWDNWAARKLRELVLAGAREYFRRFGGDPDHPDYKIVGISCWANALRHGGALQIHHHDPGFISAHYNVQSGNDEETLARHSDSGHTIYYRPGFIERSHGGDQAGPTSPWDSEWFVSHPPEEGRLIFFPSYVRHEVRPYVGPTERITIAMDVYIAKQAAMMYFGGPRWYVPE